MHLEKEEKERRERRLVEVEKIPTRIIDLKKKKNTHTSQSPFSFAINGNLFVCTSLLLTPSSRPLFLLTRPVRGPPR
jgi:formate/nitrite transporter FocA (FNT family)